MSSVSTALKSQLIFGFYLLTLSLAYGQNNSVLSSGNWHKIAVPTQGIYKLDKAYLESLGIQTQTIDPRNLALYGNGGGGMLPQENAQPRPVDLTENAIFVSGEEDGIFHDQDYVLFYGNSAHKLEYDLASEAFYHEKNLYADSTIYFVTVKGDRGKRIQNRADAGQGFTRVNSYFGIQIHEEDLTNFIHAGRRWFGQRLTQGASRSTLNFTSNDIVSGSEIAIISSVMSQGFEESSFDVSLNNQSLGRQIMLPVPEGTYEVKGNIQTDTFKISVVDLGDVSGGFKLDIDYNPATTGVSTGFLDYVLLQTVNQLRFQNGLFFHSRNDGLDYTYEMTEAPSSLMVWDVSDPTTVVAQDYSLQNDMATFGVNLPTTAFVAFEGSNFPPPVSMGAVQNQNLHGLSGVDALFITHDLFLSEAQRLADFRSQRDGLSIHVVTVDQIYNEFGSGMQDVSAIRDFARYHYEAHGQNLKYLLLFGDCSYDYKRRAINNHNFVPVYEARNSLDPIDSFSSDDYFGFMEDDEGEWIETRLGDHTMELGIGRIPAKTIDEARAVVNKIIRYQTSTNAFGSWRNEIVFIADDGDQNIHQRDANRLATYVDTARRAFNVQKIYLDAFDQVPGPNGERSPAARAAIQEAIERGSLMINYTGHGNEVQLAHEDIIDETIIAGLSNRLKLPFFITATCEFGNYDNPLRVSGGESIILNPNGGAIALLTTTRPVFSNTNFILNRAYYFSALDKENGQFPRLGDIVRNTKNASLQGPVNRNFALLGDPTMRIAFPQYALRLMTVNGKVPNEADTLKALSQVSITGEVIDVNDNRITDFNGTLSATVFDKQTQFTTKGNESDSPPIVYDQRDVLLFKGDATVSDGTFSFDFIVPKNISYVFGNGKISMYAVNENKNLDAHGASAELIIGGSNANTLTDNTPPEVDLFMNDSTFVSGQVVGPNPILLARLSDENGINISSAGFGQDIIATVNDAEGIILNEFYSASENTFQRGWVVYEMTGLQTGKYTLNLKAYDTHGNASEKSIEFVVSDETNIKLSEVKNYPNPIIDGTTFSFTHDREGEELHISLNVINLEGRVILERSYRFDDSPGTINNIQWDGRDVNGNRIKKGIYIYKIIVQSTLDGAKNQAFGKLVVYN